MRGHAWAPWTFPGVVALFAVSCTSPLRPDLTFQQDLQQASDHGAFVSNVPALSPAGTRDQVLALDPLFQYWGKPPLVQDEASNVDPDAVLPEIELATRLAESRDLWAFASYGSMDALESRLVAGVPVLVMIQDEPANRKDRRYAVVHGFNHVAKTLIVHEGKRRPTVLTYGQFRSQWRPVRHWMMVVLPPEKVAWDMDIKEHRALARYWENRGQTDLAVRELQQAQQKIPPNADLMTGQALIWQRAGNLKKAEALYRDALALDEFKARAANNLAIVISELGGDLAEAERWVRRALTLEPSNPYFLDTLGHVLLDQGKPQEAADVLERARRRAGQLTSADQRVIATRLIEAYLQTGNRNLARQVWMQQKDRDPDWVLEDNLRVQVE